MMQTVFIILKLVGAVDWDWALVLIPLYIYAAAVVAALILGYDLIVFNAAIAEQMFGSVYAF